MNDEELKKAIDIIINKPIIIQNMTSEDNKEYIGFDKENFETLEQTYYNCQYFTRNQEQLMINLKDKDKEIERLNKLIETKNKRIKKLEDNNKELKALLKEYKYELGLQELENTSIVSMD